jgi:exodeoxyribonuclease V beta subunit
VTAATTPFDPIGELRSGRWALQASAGTGKTFTLAALATRFIAERAVPSSELLIVTFTRAATSELRARVRDQITEAAAVLGGDVPPPEGDVLMHHLMATDRHGRLERLRRAVTEFDAATITTIHGFATQVRGMLGVSSIVDAEARLVGDVEELVEQACADVLATAAVETDRSDELPSLRTLVTATRAVADRPDLALEPHDADQGAPASLILLRRLVLASVSAMVERRRAGGTLSFDDVLVQLRDALHGDRAGAVIDSLRSRFSVALIDEFQDTDSVQWEIFSSLFGDPESAGTLVLVGDPKQAIYRFRGADIQTYLRAVGEGSGTELQTLDTNWRSDGAVLTSLHALFEGATFGAEDIRYVPVQVAPGHRDRRLRTAAGDPLPALCLRLAIGADIARNRPDQVRAASAASAVDRDLVSYVRGMLDSAVVPTDHPGDAPNELRPCDIAVLVGSATQGEAIRSALQREGVPAVVAGGGSVLDAPAAHQMRLLLGGILRPDDARAVRAFALSWFVGWTANQVAEATDEALAPLQEQLASWATLLASRPVADALARIWRETEVVARTLRSNDGDRNVTDLDHLAELLRGAAPGGRSGVSGLVDALEARPEEEADTDTDGSIAARRIESEADAVQIMTIWKAKGLEFPVVCVPTLWRSPQSRDPLITTDPATGRRALDLGKGILWPDKATASARKAEAEAEVAGEQLRVLYVALTRARHQTVVWWGNTMGSPKTALAHVLFARTDGVIDADLFGRPTVDIPPDSEIAGVLDSLKSRSGGTMDVSVIDGASPGSARWVDRSSSGDREPLGLASFGNTLDRSVHRWSFSSITQRSAVAGFDPYDPSLSDRGAGDEGDSAGGYPEPGPAGVTTAGDDIDLDSHSDSDSDGAAGRANGSAGPAPGPLAPLPAGTSFGTLVHALLEVVDFGATDLDDQLSSALDRLLVRIPVDLTPVPAPEWEGVSGRTLLIDGLRAAVETPLGRAFGGMRLADLRPEDRVNELTFDLRLGERGHHPTGRHIGAMVVDHLERHDPLRTWAEQLADGSIDVELAGYLTGSIDLVARVGAADGSRSFVVADYKTNLLTPRGRPPAADDYAPSRLASAMAEHHYPLQALLYAVALHRYLRWRLRAYRPSEHLGGAAYLFVRGMTGPDVAMTGGQPHGVYDWPIPWALVSDLSDLLDGRVGVATVR